MSREKEALLSWAELAIEVRKIAERVEELQSLRYVPFTTPALTRALNKVHDALVGNVGGLVHQAVLRQEMKAMEGIRARRSAMVAAQRASGMPELVGRLPQHLRPRSEVLRHLPMNRARKSIMPPRSQRPTKAELMDRAEAARVFRVTPKLMRKQFKEHLKSTVTLASARAKRAKT